MQDDSDSPQLSATEIELLRWLLPADRPGYDAYYSDILRASVLGVGRWGPGDHILGAPGTPLDISGPMERVFAYGAVQYADGQCSLSVHENVTGLTEVQFACSGAKTRPGTDGIVSRFCYSYWEPGDKAPGTQTAVREITLDADSAFVLAVSPGDERMWLYEQHTRVNHLIPHMNFHTELMRQSGIREQEKVFRPKLVFQQPDDFDDAVLREAFIAYNKRWAKVTLPDAPPMKPKPGVFKRLFKRT